MDIANAFADILAKNDFKNVSLSLNPACGAGYEWSASVQWHGFSRDGIGCTHGSGATPVKALVNAIEVARLDRAPLPDIEIPEMEISELGA